MDRRSRRFSAPQLDCEYDALTWRDPYTPIAPATNLHSGCFVVVQITATYSLAEISTPMTLLRTAQAAYQNSGDKAQRKFRRYDQVRHRQYVSVREIVRIPWRRHTRSRRTPTVMRKLQGMPKSDNVSTLPEPRLDWPEGVLGAALPRQTSPPVRIRKAT